MRCDRIQNGWRIKFYAYEPGLLICAERFYGRAAKRYLPNFSMILSFKNRHFSDFST